LHLGQLTFTILRYYQLSHEAPLSVPTEAELKKNPEGNFFQRGESSAVETTTPCGLSNRNLCLRDIAIRNYLMPMRKAVF
jgi:hypothetical protein